MEDIKTIWSSPVDAKYFTEIFQLSCTLKFKIRCDHFNGSSVGFNNHCCLSVMTQDHTWQTVADNRELGFTWKNCYDSQDGSPEIATMNKKASEKFKEFANLIWNF